VELLAATYRGTGSEVMSAASSEVQPPRWT
jgi:hypothetical protein